MFPGIAYPRVPGHEVAGVVDAVGADVPLFKAGQRVGLGWHGGHCNYCTPCRRGDFILCENAQISGITFDGGYADYVIAPANALALVPDDLSDVDAAPLMCAGVTTYNSLRHSGAKPGDLVAILGIGGLGHLGCSTRQRAATARWPLRAERTRLRWRSSWARTSTSTAPTQDFAAELQKLGGAAVILSTLTNAESLTQAVGGLGTERKADHCRRAGQAV
jgi:D-arabinose 1-dehydrogenase-like Zn-dependent alcohol dehydrogenase